MKKNNTHKNYKQSSEELRWDVNVDYTKSIFHGGKRGTVVTVKDKKTGNILKKSITAKNKNEIRAEAKKLASMLINELK